jgi:UDP-N-acetylglucosamine 2-epimerase (non-hydrolysing)
MGPGDGPTGEEGSALIRRVFVVMGTRPEAIKLAPLILALAGDSGFDVRVAVTAQHREMLDQVLDLFGIEPDVDLDILEPGQTLTEVSLRALAGLSQRIEEERPDVVLVQGDTTTTLMGALAAFYHRVPVVHLEAGLRTGERYAPFPEEINRCLTTSLTTLHLAPTPASRENLRREGVEGAAIAVTGNTVIDALDLALARKRPLEEEWLGNLEGSRRPLLLVTAHRRESWGDGMAEIGEAVAEIARRFPGVDIVLPIHRNPVVRDAIVPRVEGLDNVRIGEPVPYGTMARLLQLCRLVLTDSGGIQEEAPALGKPVLVMRKTTERPEAVAAGVARLVGTDSRHIVAAVTELLCSDDAYARMSTAINPYGDGHAVARCVAAIRHLLGAGEQLADFSPDGGAPGGGGLRS